MKYVSYCLPDGQTGIGFVDGEYVVDLKSKFGTTSLRELLNLHQGLLPTFIESPNSPRYALSDVTLLPVVPNPTKIVAAPVNYFDHKAEMNEDAHIDTLGVFLKAPSSVLAHQGTVQLPYTDRRFDQEGEFAFVMGRNARNISAAEAHQYIAGYTCLLDMTMRGGEDRSTRKSFDTFTPVGPYLVTPGELGDLKSLRLQTWVNDELRQDADIADLIWGVPELLAYVSSVMTLEAGDIVTTGTPAGVGQIFAGDVVTVEITRIGRLSVTVSAETATLCPTKGASRGPKPPAILTPVRHR